MSEKPRVLNRRTDGIPRGAVYVGRPSKWGNPFQIGRDGDRAEVIERFRRETLPDLDVRPLIGRSLVCYCAPLPCHADLLLEAAAAQPPTPTQEASDGG